MSEPSQPALFYFGANHQLTPIDWRERLAITEDKRPALRQRLHNLSGLREYTVLNTCNRVEFYGVADSPTVIEALESEFCQLQGFTRDAFAAFRQAAHGRDAIHHLLEVSSGLNSQMLGETEILGQVKEAYAKAQKDQTVGPVLNRLFQKTFQHAKYVRTHTAITEGQISIANVAVDLAQKIFGELDTVRLLLLGAGDIGEKTAKAFQSRGARAPSICSRRLDRATELAEQFGGLALPFDTIGRHIGDFDIIVCSTAAPQVVVPASDVHAAMQRRRAQPLFFIDLALPRDVDPAVASISNVFVYNLDDLARIAEENRAAREAEVIKAKALITERANALWEQVTQSIQRL